MIHQFLNKDSKTNWGYIIGYFILFLIAPPFIAIPTIIVYMVTKSHATKSDYYLCFFAIAGYFAAINATKRMGGDQWQYYVNPSLFWSLYLGIDGSLYLYEWYI